MYIYIYIYDQERLERGFSLYVLVGCGARGPVALVLELWLQGTALELPFVGFLEHFWPQAFRIQAFGSTESLREILQSDFDGRMC